MTKRSMKNSLLVVLLAAFSLLSAGCAPAAVGIAGILGYLLGATNAPTVTTQQCTLNGQPVDCSTVN